MPKSLYKPKTIPTSSRCGTICSTQIPTIPPSNKESPCKLNYLHTGRSNAPSRSNSSLRGKTARLNVKYQLQSVTPLHRVVAGTPIAKEHHCQISRESNISFTGAFCASGVGRPLCAFAPLGDLHRRTSPTHTTKFGTWL